MALADAKHVYVGESTSGYALELDVCYGNCVVRYVMDAAGRELPEALLNNGLAFINLLREEYEKLS